MTPPGCPPRRTTTLGAAALLGALALAAPAAAQEPLPPGWLAGGPGGPFGTDAAGRPMGPRILSAAGVTLAIALGAVAAQAVVGLPLGRLARRGGALLGAAEAQAALSPLLIALVAMAALGPGLPPAGTALLLALALGLAAWPLPALAAARPGATPLAAAAPEWLARAVAAEAAISFAGLGMPADRPSLGTLLAEAPAALEAGRWWLLAGPGAALALVLLALVLLSERLARPRREGRP
jgi:peptide/nickel transport system permease protein